MSPRITPAGAGTMAILLTACLPALAAAQTAPASAARTEKRWSVSGAFAGTSRGHEGPFEAAMRAARFDETAHDFNGRPMSYPGSGGEPSSELELVYRWKRRLAIGLLRAPVGLGSTTGYQDPYRYFSLDQKVTIVAPIAYLRVGRHLRVGAGPLAAWTRVSHEESPGQSGTASTSFTGGAMVAAAVEGNPLRVLHLAFSISYRKMGSVTVDPVTAAFPTGPPATLPAFTANLSHRSAGVSLGVRF
jgi:hypothetical protein